MGRISAVGESAVPTLEAQSHLAVVMAESEEDSTAAQGLFEHVIAQYLL